jgi:hypothetical protein
MYPDGRDHMSLLLVRRANIALQLHVIAGNTTGASLDACTRLAPIAVARVG